MRNRLINVSVFIVLLSLTFFACKKDTKDAELKSYFTYQDKNYELSKGMLQFYGEYNVDPSTFNFDIMLLSSGLTLSETTGNLTGKGHAFIVEMFSSSETELVTGTYTFDINQTGDANSFDYGFFFLNGDASTEVAEVEAEIKSGTVKVEKTGSTYKITINCIDEFDKPITGFYEGTLQYSDYSGLKSTLHKKSIFRY